MIFQFQCIRKHLIFDKQYLLTYDGSSIFIGETKAKPKYQLEVSLRSTITFHIDDDFYGFSIPYQGQQKLFRANANKIQEFKKLIDAKIVYLDMNQFYLPQQVLGVGAFSQVQMVQNLYTKQLVAAKFLNKIREGKSNTERMNDIINEIQILYRLNHPNIVKIKEIYDKSNQIVIIHEYVDGQTLERFINEHGTQLHQTEIQSIMREILLAIVYIHEQGLLHRDIKPDNIMIDKNLNIKIIDFGLATKQGSPLCIQKCGTPGYIAPEIINSKKSQYNTKSDIFSLGVVFYKLITSQDLFQQSQLDNLQYCYQENILSMEHFIEYNIPESCFDLLSSMLFYDKNKRISAKECLQHNYFKESLRPSAKKSQILLQQSTQFVQQQQQQQQSTMFQSQLSEGSRKYSRKISDKTNNRSLSYKKSVKSDSSI
ncbi:unnamed protein product [Paramecium pentaurelia]|uniref:Protein kinase domain-containing protein n=1 Tax=Paramecium pentaurelia TaxID=43138 RepID=A0A8S1X8R4_9CILI|nr:unnamed protein product [Paramecium pentaurelia]